MALSTYTELQTAIREELDIDSTTLPDAKLANAINIAEGKINRRARFREMEVIAYAAYPAGGQDIESRRLPLPSKFLEMFALWIRPATALDTEYKEVRYIAPGRIYEYYDQSVMRYTLRKKLEFSAAVATDHRVMMHYFEAWDLANEGEGVNWLLTNYPDVYFYGALAECEPYLRNDQRVVQWLSLFNAAIDELNELDERGRDDADLDTREIAMIGRAGRYNVVVG